MSQSIRATEPSTDPHSDDVKQLATLPLRTAFNTAEGRLRILLVEDSRTEARLVMRMLEELKRYGDVTICWEQTLAGALERIDTDRVDVALLDLNLPDSADRNTITRISQRSPKLPVIILTGNEEDDLVAWALSEGVQDYLVKGQVIGNQLVRTVLYAVARKHSQVELVRLNEELQRKGIRLGQLAETAERFVDNVSHEFRTPLTVIQQFAQIIADGLAGPVTLQQLEYLGRIDSSVGDLAQMVDDLLDCSRLKAGTLRVNRHRCTVTEIVEAVRPALAAKAAIKEIEFDESIPADLPDIYADTAKAGRVLLNLAVNAIKYSPENSRVRLWASKDACDRVWIGVTDVGPGMSEDELNVIFGRFVRANGGSTAKGVGLGLHIAQDLVSLNLGTIQVESQLGKGSTFSFTLPRYDWTEIIKSYFDRLAFMDDQVLLSLLDVTTSATTESLAAVRSFLANHSRPMDVILGDADTGGLVLLGLTGDPEDWAARLEMSRIKATQSDALTSVPEFHLTAAGTWPYPDEADKAKETLRQFLFGKAEK